MEDHAFEVHRLNEDVEVEGETFAEGSYVVRMDQPFSRGADMLLDKQYYNPDDPRPYDDVGWTVGPLFNAKTVRIEDTGDPRRRDDAWSKRRRCRAGSKGAAAASTW